MKRVLLISAILLVIFASCFFGLQFINKINSDMTALLKQTISEIEQNNIENAISCVNDAQELWDKSSHVMNTYINNQSTEIVDKNLIRLSHALQREDIGTAMLLLDELFYDLQHIYESEIPFIRNVMTAIPYARLGEFPTLS